MHFNNVARINENGYVKQQFEQKTQIFYLRNEL